MGFFDIDRWGEIWQTIARNKKRSIMTALGIFWGIFMLVVMLGAGAGMERFMRATLGGISTNTLFYIANPTATPYQGMPTERNWTMENADVEAVRALDEVQYASGMVFGNEMKCSHNEHKGNYGLMGYSPDMQHIQPQPIIHGRYINEIDMLRKRKVCVIGTQVWKDLFPGGENPEGKVIKVGPFYFTVIGVARKQGKVSFGRDQEQCIIVPTTLAQQLFGRGNNVDVIALAGDEHTDSKHMEQAGKEVIFAQHIIAPNDPKAIWTLSLSEMFSNGQKLISGIALLTWIVGLGTLLAGIIGVSNIMLVLVKERTQEIGIRRAIGARPRVIITQILSESFVLTFIAGVLGLAAAVGLLSVVDSIFYQMMVAAQDGPDVTWQISFGTGILSLTILVLGSLAAGVIPASRALKIKAVDAIREE
ncbi:MAG: ABC transporter permease [Alistipes sp.]